MRPVMGFPLVHIAVNHLNNITFYNGTNLGSFNVYHLKRPFTLAHDAMNYHKWYFCFLDS
jgi:hypothetical protein